MENHFWQPFGETRWRDFAETAGATELQLKFAVARFSGASAAAAAKIAGYAGDHDSMRRAGYDAVRSTAVVNLLELAQINAPEESELTDREVDAKIAKLVRSADPNVSMKAAELYDKRKQRQGISGGMDTSRLHPAEHVLVTALLSSREGGYPPELFIATWALMAIRENAWCCPLLRQMLPYLKHNLPAIWSIARRHLAQWRPADLEAVEIGQVLTADQIFDIAAKHTGLLLTVIDGAGDTVARENAYEELRKIGVIEPMPNTKEVARAKADRSRSAGSTGNDRHGPF